MFSFFKRKKEYPEFPALKRFVHRDSYLVRTAPWRLLDKSNISVFDPHNPRVFTLDPWPQEIFLSADGQMTVSEYTYYMADKYSGAILTQLDETIIQEIEKLFSIESLSTLLLKENLHPIMMGQLSKPL